MPISNLEQINRQKTAHAKATVQHILNGKHAEAMRSLPTREVQTEQAKVKTLYGQKHGISDTIAKAERIVDARKAKTKTTEKLSDQEKSTLRNYKDELKQAAQKDNAAVIKALAKDYAALSPKERAETLVITATNADRTSINAEIRTNLKAAGEVTDSRMMQVLERKDMTAEEAKRAVNYQQGDIVKFAKDYKSIGLARGEQVTVLKTDSRTNTITAVTSRGSTVIYQPHRHQTQAYRGKERELGTGDKIKFTENSRDFKVKNGQAATIERINGASLTVRLEDGKTQTIDTSKYPHIDHAYTSTSQAAQGQSVSRTMVHHNTEAGKHNERETYVNATRAQLDTTLYTQDKLRAAEQAGLSINKEIATPERTNQRENDKDYGL
jgi:ATP-dependent exoDNAse (exonuclease V) alpha subunit